jgi:hypothetical protein
MGRGKVKHKNTDDLLASIDPRGLDDISYYRAASSILAHRARELEGVIRLLTKKLAKTSQFLESRENYIKRLEARYVSRRKGLKKAVIVGTMRDMEIKKVLEWLDQNTAFYDTILEVGSEPGVREQTPKRVWFHATDDQHNSPFSAVIAAALNKQAQEEQEEQSN